MSTPYQEAIGAVNAAREGLEATVIAAKDAYRADPSEENLAAKRAAVADLQAARADQRAGGRPLVAGDVTVTDVDKNVHPNGIPAGLTANEVLDDFNS